MAAINVTTTALEVSGSKFGRSRLLIQNLGPGKLYLDSSDEVSTEDSFEIAVGGVYETPGTGSGSTLWVVSDTNANVRVVGL